VTADYGIQTQDLSFKSSFFPYVCRCSSFSKERAARMV